MLVVIVREKRPINQLMMSRVKSTNRFDYFFDGLVVDFALPGSFGEKRSADGEQILCFVKLRRGKKLDTRKGDVVTRPKNGLIYDPVSGKVRSHRHNTTFHFQ
jgi:hypothetical protein